MFPNWNFNFGNRGGQNQEPGDVPLETFRTNQPTETSPEEAPAQPAPPPSQSHISDRVTGAANPTFVGIGVPVPTVPETQGRSFWRRVAEGVAGYVAESGTDKVKLLMMSTEAHREITHHTGNEELSNFLKEIADSPELQAKFFDFTEELVGTQQFIHDNGVLVTDIVFRLVVPRIIARLAKQLREDLKDTPQENQPLSLAFILSYLTTRIDYHLAESGGDRNKAALRVLKLVIGEPDDLPIKNLVGLFRGTVYDLIVEGIAKGIQKYQEYKSTLGDGFFSDPNRIDEFSHGTSSEIPQELANLLPTLGSLVVKNPAVQQRLLALLHDNLGMQFKPQQQRWLIEQLSILGNLEDPNTRLLWSYLTSLFECTFTHVLVSAAGTQEPGRDLLVAISENLGSKLNTFFVNDPTLAAEYDRILQQNQEPEENGEFVERFAPLAKELRQVLGLGPEHIPKLLAANFSLLNDVQELYVQLNQATVSRVPNETVQGVAGFVMNEGVRPFVNDRLPGVAANALKDKAPKLLSLFSNFVAELAMETAPAPQAATAGPAPTAPHVEVATAGPAPRAPAVDVASLQPQIEHLSDLVQRLVADVVRGLNTDDPRAQRVWEIIQNTITGLISQANQDDAGINSNITLEIARAFVQLEEEQGARLTTLYNSLKNRGKNPVEEEVFIKQFEPLSAQALRRLGIEIDSLDTPAIVKKLIKVGLDSIPEFLAQGYEQYINLQIGLKQIERRTLRAGNEIDTNTDTGYALKKLPKILTENGLSLGKAFLQNPQMREKLAKSALEAAGIEPGSEYYPLALGLVTDQIALVLRTDDPIVNGAWTLVQDRVQGILELALSTLAAGNESMDPTASIYRNVGTLLTTFVKENDEAIRLAYNNREQYKRYLIRQGKDPQADNGYLEMDNELKVLFEPLAKQIQNQFGLEDSEEARITGPAGALINWFFENKLPSYLAENYVEYIRPVADLVQAVNRPEEPEEQIILGVVHPTEAVRCHQLAQFFVGKLKSLNPETISTSAEEFIEESLPKLLQTLSERSGAELPADAIDISTIQESAAQLVSGVLGTFFASTQTNDPSLRPLWTFVENRLTDLLAHVVTHSPNYTEAGGDASLAFLNLGIRDVHSKYIALKNTRDAIARMTRPIQEFEQENLTNLIEQEKVQRLEFENEFKRIIEQLQQRFGLIPEQLPIPEILKPLVTAALERAPALAADAYRECMSPVDAKEKFRTQLIEHFREMGIANPAILLNHVDTLLSELAASLTEKGIQEALNKLRELSDQPSTEPLDASQQEVLSRIARIGNVVRGEGFTSFSHTYVKDVIMSLGYQIAVQYLDRVKRDEQGNDVRVRSFLSAVTNIAKVLDAFVSEDGNVDKVAQALTLVDPEARKAALQEIFLPVTGQILELFGVPSLQEGANQNRLIIPFYDLLMPLIQEHVPGAIAAVVAEQVVPVANFMIQERENVEYLRGSLPELVDLADAIADFLPGFLPAFLSNTRDELSGDLLTGLIDLLKDVDNFDKINKHLKDHRQVLEGILGEDVYRRLDNPQEIQLSKKDLRRCVTKAKRERGEGFSNEALNVLVELLEEEDRKYLGVVEYLNDNRVELVRMLGEDLYKLLDDPEFLRLPKEALRKYVRAALVKAAAGIAKSIDRFEDVNSPGYNPDFLLNLSTSLLGELELHVRAIEEARKNAGVKLAHQTDHEALIEQFEKAGILHTGIPKLKEALEARRQIKEKVKEIASVRRELDKAKTGVEKNYLRAEIKGLQGQLAELKKIEGDARQDFFRPLTEKLLKITEIQLEDAPFPEAVKVSLFHKVATVLLPSAFENMFQMITEKDTRYTLAMLGLTKLEDTLDEQDRVKETMTLKEFRKNYAEVLELEQDCVLNGLAHTDDQTLIGFMKGRLGNELKEGQELVIEPFTLKYLGKGLIGIRSSVTAEEKPFDTGSKISACILSFKGIDPETKKFEIQKDLYQDMTLKEVMNSRLRRAPREGDVIEIYPLTLRWIGDGRVAIKSSVKAPSDPTQAQINEAVGGLVQNILGAVGPTAASLFLNVLHIGNETAEAAIGEAFRDKFGSVYTLKSLAQEAIQSGTETLKELGPTYKVDKEEELQKLEEEELKKLSTEEQKRLELKDQMRRVIHKAYIEAAVSVAKKIGSLFKSAWDKTVRFVFRGHAQAVFDFMERLGNSFVVVIVSKILQFTLGNLIKGAGKLISAIVFAIWDVISINKRVEEAVQYLEMDIHENFLYKATDILLDALENPEAAAARGAEIQQRERDEIERRRRERELEAQRIRDENDIRARQRGAFVQRLIDLVPRRARVGEPQDVEQAPSDVELDDLAGTPHPQVDESNSSNPQDDGSLSSDQ